MEPEGRPAQHPAPPFPLSASSSEEWGLRSRIATLEEAVSLALFASAWLQHSRRDPRASAGARAVARLLAASSGQPVLQGPDTFAAARRFLEEEYD